MKTIVTVIGARPQFIKASVLSRLILKEKNINEILIHTGQHFDHNMSNVFFNELDIPAPKFNLSISGGGHGAMTANMLELIEPILIKLKPSAVLVYGDTNSTLAAVLAAAKLNIPIIHVEAGLRSYDKSMPEEINRLITDHLSSLLLCPNQESVINLKKEGIIKNVYNSGDIMVDSFNHFYNDINSSKTTYDCLLTIHRPSNLIKNKLVELFKNIEASKLSYIFPIHPRTENTIKSFNIIIPKNVTVSMPLSYSDIIKSLHNVSFVLTDSGGLQKEAYLAKKKTIILREQTEWNDILKTGWGVLSSPENILEKLKSITDIPVNHPPIFGEEGTGEKILRHIKSII